MTLAGVVTTWSDGFLVAAAGRLASGVGAVLMNILLAKMIADWFAEREMSSAMAVMLSAWPVGLLLARAKVDEAAAGEAFLRVIAIARDQHARWTELRAVVSCARLWQRQGRRREARDMLAAMYAWFTEGLHTPVLSDAGALLEQL